MEGNAALVEPLHDRETAILQRLAAGLSDQQIADDLQLSLHTIKWYNRQIYSKLGVNSRTQAVACAKNRGLLHNDTAGVPRIVVGYHLPAQAAPFVGRTREQAAVRHLLRRSRLLTLTGTGGIGKTRLALQVAEQLSGTFADGICFVDLAPLADHTLVLKTIAGALSVVEQGIESLVDTLKRVLVPRDMLLLIDNFEHVITAAPLLSALLAAAPRVNMLVTSREPLHLAGEQEYAVPPLSLPPAGAVTAQDLADSEAGALFVRRVQLAVPHFEATDANAPAIARICLRLDGLPLAIELAAARCKLLSPHALLARLEGATDAHPFQALASNARDAPPRQRTLRDTLAWSYNLLDADERRLFRRLGIFAGGCTLQQAERVCDMEPHTALKVGDGIEALVNKSLLRHHETEPGELRLVMLETIREYALECLAVSGERDVLGRRHALACVELAEAAKLHLDGPHQVGWIRRLDVEHANFRAALTWLRTAPGSSDLELRLVVALTQFWQVRGYFSEGRAYVEGAIERSAGHSAVRAHAYQAAGFLASHYDDFAAARAMVLQSLALYEQLGETRGRAKAIQMLGMLAASERDYARAAEHYGQCLALERSLANQWGIAVALFGLGNVAYLQGDFRRAQALLEDSLALSRALGNGWAIARRLARLGHVALAQRNVELAVARLQASLDTSEEVYDSWGRVMALAGIAGVVSARGSHVDAARLLAATAALLDGMGARLWFADRVDFDRHVAATQAGLDQPTFAAAWSEGQALTIDQAVAYARELGTFAAAET